MFKGEVDIEILDLLRIGQARRGSAVHNRQGAVGHVHRGQRIGRPGLFGSLWGCGLINELTFQPGGLVFQPDGGLIELDLIEHDPAADQGEDAVIQLHRLHSDHTFARHVHRDVRGSTPNSRLPPQRAD